MSQRPKYKTKQRETILQFFEGREGVHVTAADVCAYFKEQEKPMGQATVYRQLENLVDEGVLNKYILDGNSPACFEYVGKECHEGKENCFHCKCEKCGKLIHLHCDELNGMQQHLQAHHNFRMDPRRTVFYGICEECEEREDS